MHSQATTIFRSFTTVQYTLKSLQFVNCVGMATVTSSRHVVGVCQMTCTSDKKANLERARELITRCKTLGAQMVFLPEACDYIANSKQESISMAESISGETMSAYKQLAKQISVWLSVGGFHQKSAKHGVDKLLNTHVILDDCGEVQGSYCKTHMFDLDIPGKIRLCESDYTSPGTEITPPIQTPVGKVGLSICYDMRFPEMSSALRNLGADILTFPSAFTVPTGMAHWHVLLRNRAIENQCYVIAAAQTGTHNDKRSSYGHSLIVDPWGTVLAECGEGEGVCIAEIDLQYINKVRTQMPVIQHRRSDLYGELTLCVTAPAIDSQTDYEFGHVRIDSQQVFLRTSLSYAFVNIKPVLPGHVLIASLRKVQRFTDLQPAEVTDLFQTVKLVSKVIEQHFGGTSLTISLQDGKESGQTVKHVHIHILPRKTGDFEENDEVYSHLEKHDNDLETDKLRGNVRSVEEMNEEAAQLRPYFNS